MSSYLLYMIMQRSLHEKYEESSEEEESDGISVICRICLRSATIPIYGDNDISREIQIFGDIEISENDDYPKHLCVGCYETLQAAIKFRESAKKSANVLKKKLVEVMAKNNKNSGCDDYSGEAVLSSSSVTNEKNDKKPPRKVEKKIVRIRRKTKPRPQKLKCRICMKMLSRNYYKNHMLLHDTSPPKYICEICGKAFKQNCAYFNHRGVHRSDFPFKCPFCPYRGKTSGLLHTHKLRHGTHKFMCSECPAQFHTKSNLNKHYRKHKQPELQCDLCKRAFHVKRELEKHLEAQHLGIKNHICETCGKGFGYRKALRQHERYVHKREKIEAYGRMPSYMQAEQNALSVNPG